MEVVDSLEDLKLLGFPPRLHLHKLKGNRKDEYAIDIHKTDGWRITFKFFGTEFNEISVENHH
jgi:plasmid maintenance system killer protein